MTNIALVTHYLFTLLGMAFMVILGIRLDSDIVYGCLSGICILYGIHLKNQHIRMQLPVIQLGKQRTLRKKAPKVPDYPPAEEV